MSAAAARVPELDGLRGIAILLVLFFHTTIVRGDSFTGALLHGLFRNFGWAGVDLFFVLSGFLITGILLDARGRPHALRSFYARRALRIFPVYYGFLILVFTIGPRVSPGAITAGDDAIYYWVYLQNFATAAAGEWAHSRFLNLFWSLAVEEHFYLVWPWLVFGLQPRTLLRGCVAILPLCLALRLGLLAWGVSPLALYVLTPTRVDALAAGCLVALAIRRPGGLPPLVRPARMIALASAVGIVALVVWQRGFSFLLPGTATAGLSLLAALFGALLVLTLGASPGGLASALLSSRPLRAFGRYSYALYVIHQAVLVVTTTLLVRHVFEPLAPEASTLTLQIAVYVVSIGGSVALAALSWRYIEAPLLSLKRHFPI